MLHYGMAGQEDMPGPSWIDGIDNGLIAGVFFFFLKEKHVFMSSFNQVGISFQTSKYMPSLILSYLQVLHASDTALVLVNT